MSTDITTAQQAEIARLKERAMRHAGTLLAVVLERDALRAKVTELDTVLRGTCTTLLRAEQERDAIAAHAEAMANARVGYCGDFVEARAAYRAWKEQQK
jgi:hypothetical protein